MVSVGSTRRRDIVDDSDESGSRVRRARMVEFGLVVGINHYPLFRDANGDRSLNGAINDATQFRDWLCAPDGGGVEQDNVELILSAPKPLRPLQAEVDKALGILVDRAIEAKGGHRLWFFFGGHGAGIETDVALLLAAWAQGPGHALSAYKYRDRLGAMQVFDEIVVLLDCCRRTASHIDALAPTLTHRPEPRCHTRFFFAYATGLRGTAFEARNTDEKIVQGLFTARVLDILWARSGITAPVFKNILENDVSDEGQEAHVEHGLRDNSTFGRSGPDSRFGKQGQLPRLVITFQDAVGIVELSHYINSRPEKIADHEATPEKPWVIERAPGRYKLADAHGHSRIFDHGGRIEILAGGTLQLATRVVL